MEPELWDQLSAAIGAVQRQSRFEPRDSYPTAVIVRVYLWAVLHDRPTRWACRARHWNRACRPEGLPDPSTMSRRLRRSDFEPFLTAVGRRLDGRAPQRLFKIVDGHALELPNHTTDRDATWGRGRSRQSLGYKLHLIDSGKPMPEAFVITPLGVCEKQMAGRMIKRVQGSGYLLGDAHYDASWLFDAVSRCNHQLLCPRAKPGTDLGHHYQAPDRLKAIERLEPPLELNPFGPSLYRQRKRIERTLGHAASFGGGMGALPSWTRRIWRVRHWVWAKLLINAARIRINTYDR